MPETFVPRRTYWRSRTADTQSVGKLPVMSVWPRSYNVWALEMLKGGQTAIYSNVRRLAEEPPCGFIPLPSVAVCQSGGKSILFWFGSNALFWEFAMLPGRLKHPVNL